MRALKYLNAYLIPLFLILGIQLGFGWSWFPVLFAFGMVPLVEILLGKDARNLNSKQEEQAQKSLTYSLILWFFVPLQWFLTIWVLKEMVDFSRPLWERAGLLASLAVSNGGIGITISHELIHRNRRFEQWLGKLLLLSVGYMHFSIEHVYGHHKRVATRHDPATARRGESVYTFWFRSVPQQWISALGIEKKRLQRTKTSVWSPKNQMIWFTLLPFGVAGHLAATLSPWVGMLFIIQAVLSFSLLECVNYLEHYGLSRHEKRPGRFEPVSEHHSWNSDHIVSRYLLFELTRHSDHHAHAHRKYQTLRSFNTSPQLPTGYPGMILLALLPPIWFAIMNPKVDFYNALTT